MHNIQVNVIKLEEQIKYCLINFREIFYCIINYAKIFTKPVSGDFTQCRPCTPCTLYTQKKDNTAYIVQRDLPVLWEMVSVPESAVSRTVRQEEARFSG